MLGVEQTNCQICSYTNCASRKNCEPKVQKFFDSSYFLGILLVLKFKKSRTSRVVAVGMPQSTHKTKFILMFEKLYFGIFFHKNI